MNPTFTERELDLMNVLWERGSATVSEVLDLLDDDSAYTTVSTLLRILVEKGYVVAKSEGRAHRYHPVVERSEAGTSALRRLTTKIFKGSPEATLTHLVSDTELTEEQLRRVKELLDDRLGGADK